MNFKVILASASPRRQELLKKIFSEFSVVISSVDETVPKNITDRNVPEYLAKLKAEDVAKKFPDDLVIGADTCVLINNEILGKPHTKDEAYNMLNKLSGNTHNVITGCAIYYNGVCTSFSVDTTVEFYKLSQQEIEDYINSDEPYDKAGGYGIQSNGALFVKAINGDYYNVVGFPVSELNRQIKNILYK